MLAPMYVKADTTVISHTSHTSTDAYDVKCAYSIMSTRRQIALYVDLKDCKNKTAHIPQNTNTVTLYSKKKKKNNMLP